MVCRHVVFLEILQPLHQLVYCTVYINRCGYQIRHQTIILGAWYQNCSHFSLFWFARYDFCLVPQEQCTSVKHITKSWHNFKKLIKVDSLPVSCAPNQWPATTAFVWYQFSIVSYRDFYIDGSDTHNLPKTIESFFFSNTISFWQLCTVIDSAFELIPGLRRVHW